MRLTSPSPMLATGLEARERNDRLTAGALQAVPEPAMTADFGEFGLALPPVGHPQVHAPLPGASVRATAWPRRVSLFVHEHVLDEVHGQTEDRPVQGGD